MALLKDLDLKENQVTAELGHVRRAARHPDQLLEAFAAAQIVRSKFDIGMG